MKQMMKENIVLTAGDGHVLPAYRIAPAAAPRGQLVVLHEFFGLNDHIRNVADRFAALGYGAIVPGLSDRAEPGAEFGYDPSGIAAGHALRARIPIADSLLDAQAAIDFVKPFGKVGVVGYCWGGSLAFYSATRLRGLTCAVGYYGSQIVAGAHEVPKVPTMLHFGDIDASIPLMMSRRSGKRGPTYRSTSILVGTDSTATRAPIMSRGRRRLRSAARSSSFGSMSGRAPDT
jgi:carboxymethylenebutenolidase